MFLSVSRSHACVVCCTQAALSLEALQVHVLVGAQDLRGFRETSKDDILVTCVQLANVSMDPPLWNAGGGGWGVGGGWWGVGGSLCLAAAKNPLVQLHSMVYIDVVAPVKASELVLNGVLAFAGVSRWRLSQRARVDVGDGRAEAAAGMPMARLCCPLLSTCSQLSAAAD
jgi:hypothetical protein